MNEVSAKEDISPNKSTTSVKRPSNSSQPAAKRVLSFLQDESIASVSTEETLLLQLPNSHHAAKKIHSSLEMFVPETPLDKLPSKRSAVTLNHQDNIEQEMLSRLSVLKETYQESISAVKASLYANDTAHPAIKLDNDMFMEWLSDKSTDLYGDLARQRIDIQNAELVLNHHRKSSKAALASFVSLNVDAGAEVMWATPLPAKYAEIAYPWYFENEISTLK
jgi:hypothetical protein